MTFSYVGGLPTLLPPGSANTLDVHATGIGAVVPQAGSGRLHYSVNGAPFQSTVMADLAAGQFRATLPVLPNCADGLRYYVTVDGQGPVTFKDPPTAPTAFYEATAAVGLTTIYESGFETAVTGWTVNNTALTGGAWQVAVPIGTTSGTQFVAPPADAEASATATRCWVTQNGVAGGSASAADVDGGPTDLVSPPLDFSGTDGFISYRRWFYCSTAEDTLVVSVSNDNANWVTVETVAAPDQNQWIARQFRVGAYVTPSANVRVRFRTSDNPNNSNTEAGMDVFRAEAFACTPCQQQVPLATNGNAFMSICGSVAPGGVATLRVVSLPALGTGLLVFDVFLAPTPWLGGTLMSPAPIVLGPIFADANGSVTAPLPIGGLLPPGWTLHTQTVYSSAPLPSGTGQTNVVRVQW